jgi:hypothetical protein
MRDDGTPLAAIGFNSNFTDISKPTLPPDVKREAGNKKPQLVLMPPIAEELTCKVMSFGAERYGPWNWRASGVDVATYISAIKRHLAAIHNGEWLDPDSGLPHMAHVAASACIVLDADDHGCLNKDVTQTTKL